MIIAYPILVRTTPKPIETTMIMTNNFSKSKSLDQKILAMVVEVTNKGDCFISDHLRAGLPLS